MTAPQNGNTTPPGSDVPPATDAPATSGVPPAREAPAGGAVPPATDAAAASGVLPTNEAPATSGSPSASTVPPAPPPAWLTNASPSAKDALLGSMTMLVAAVIVHDVARGRIVLLRRGRGSPFGHGLWDLPVGKCEPGEPVTAAAVRELREETGLVVAPEALTLAHVLHAGVGTGAPNGYLTVVFATRTWSGEPENREPGKHDHVGWVQLDALPREFVPSTQKVLQSWLAGWPGPTLHRWDRAAHRLGDPTPARPGTGRGANQEGAAAAIP